MLIPLPKIKVIEKYYKKEFSYNTGLINEKIIRKQSKKIIQSLIKLNPSGKSILDIGSGYGFFLDEAKKLKFECTGIELSEELYNYSKKAYKLNIINSELEHNIGDNLFRFDFIVLIHVIEHIVNPVEFINSILDCLNPNGILYIETPNLRSHLFDIEKKNYTFLTPPDHIYIFSHTSFQNILDKISRGKIIKTITYSYSEHFMGILKNLLHRSTPTTKTINQNLTSSKIVHNKSLRQKINYFIFDKFIAKCFYRLLNMNNKGTFLSIFITQK